MVVKKFKMRHSRILLANTFLLMALLIVGSACRKEDNVAATSTKPDSTAINSFFTNPGNYLATSGTLELKVNGTTLNFDAATDSIALVNLTTVGNKQFYGLSAINKAHTASFGITSAGLLHVSGESDVAGSQLLVLSADKQPVTAYSLSAASLKTGTGSLNFNQFAKDSLLTKGRFITYLTKNGAQAGTSIKVEGSFSLQFK